MKKKDILVDKEARMLSNGYIFLLSSMVILFVTLHSFNLYIFYNVTNYSIFILPILFFLMNAILKEVGYREGIKALIISGIVLIFMNIIVDIIFGIDFNIIKYIGLVIAYMLSQFTNLMFYYYMLDNYSTPYFLVVANFIFSSLIYNMFYMLFVENLVFSENFWASYMIVVVIQILISMICGIILKFIKQGVDI